jgi:YD repeat-containing protein
LEIGLTTEHTENTEVSWKVYGPDMSATTGRLASAVHAGAGGATVNYTGYDSNGNLLSVNQSGNGTITRTYDGLNRVTSYTEGMNRGDRLQSDRGHRLHIDWGVCPGKMSYQWNRNNDLLIWRKAVDLR